MGAKAKHDIAPRIRRWFSQGVAESARQQGKTPTELFADMFTADPLGTLNAVARYTVREKSVDHRHTGKVELAQTHSLDTWLSGFKAGADAKLERLSEVNPGLEGQSGAPAGENALSVPERPVLPAAVCPEPEGRGESLVIREDQGDPGESE